MATYEINTHEPEAKPPSSSRRRLSNREIGILCALAVVAVGGVLLWLFSRSSGPAPAVAPKLPPANVAPTSENLVELVKFAGTPTFAALPPEQQAPYLKLLTNEDRLADYVNLYFNKSITEEQGIRAMMNIMPAVIAQQAKEWMAKGTQAERDAYVDKALDDFDRMYAKIQAAAMLRGMGSMFSGRSSSAEGTPGGGEATAGGPLIGRGGPGERERQGRWDPAWIKDLVESHSPGDRTAMGEYMAALRLRAKQRFGR